MEALLAMSESPRARLLVLAALLVVALLAPLPHLAPPPPPIIRRASGESSVAATAETDAAIDARSDHVRALHSAQECSALRQVLLVSASSPLRLAKLAPKEPKSKQIATCCVHLGRARGAGGLSAHDVFFCGEQSPSCVMLIFLQLRLA